MTFSDFTEKIFIKIIAILIVIFMYLVFLFYKVLVPGIVVSFLTGISLVQSILIYFSFILAFLILKKLLDGGTKIKPCIDPLEDLIE